MVCDVRVVSCRIEINGKYQVSFSDDQLHAAEEFNRLARVEVNFTPESRGRPRLYETFHLHQRHTRATVGNEVKVHEHRFFENLILGAKDQSHISYMS